MRNNYIVQLKQIMERGNVSQAQLARQLGVTFAALNRWINRHAKPRPSKLEDIQKLFQEVVGYPSISTQELARGIKEAKILVRKDVWDKISTNDDLQDDLLLEHTYNSTSIEGTTFTKRETENVMFNKGIIPGKNLIEHLEVTNHASVLRQIFQKKIVRPISEEWIKELHKGLIHGIRDDAGVYSKHQRGIRGVDIVLTHASDIPEEMGTLIQEWKKGPKSKTIKEIADFHVSFELIHPFGDGNGRVGRLIMVYQCLQIGYPPVIIENSRKEEYYDVLEYAQKKKDDPFILFLVDEMKTTHKKIKKYI